MKNSVRALLPLVCAIAIYVDYPFYVLADDEALEGELGRQFSWSMSFDPSNSDYYDDDNNDPMDEEEVEKLKFELRGIAKKVIHEQMIDNVRAELKRREELKKKRKKAEEGKKVEVEEEDYDYEMDNEFMRDLREKLRKALDKRMAEIKDEQEQKNDEVETVSSGDAPGETDKRWDVIKDEVQRTFTQPILEEPTEMKDRKINKQQGGVGPGTAVRQTSDVLNEPGKEMKTKTENTRKDIYEQLSDDLGVIERERWRRITEKILRSVDEGIPGERTGMKGQKSDVYNPGGPHYNHDNTMRNYPRIYLDGGF